MFVLRKLQHGNSLAWSGLVWPDLVWSGLVWPGLVWPGLAWSGLVWPSLAWMQNLKHFKKKSDCLVEV